MSQTVLYLLIFVCIVISAVAVFYIIRHNNVIKDAKQQQKVQNELTEKRYRERREYLIESIHVISQAVGNDEKLTNAEACMRLTPLLEALAPHLLSHSDYAVIYDFYKRIEHIPIKDEWKKLSKQKRWGYLKDMQAADAELGGSLHEAAAKLAKYDFDNMMH